MKARTEKGKRERVGRQEGDKRRVTEGECVMDNGKRERPKRKKEYLVIKVFSINESLPY